MSTVPLRLRYAGACQDPVTGGYLLGNGYRTYVPALMRFAAQDEMSPFGPGGVNPYVYCVADPINLTDPSGHAPGGAGRWDNFVSLLEELESIAQEPIAAVRNVGEEAAGPAGSQVSHESLITPSDKSHPFREVLAAQLMKGRPMEKDILPMNQRYAPQLYPAAGTVFGLRRLQRESAAQSFKFELYDLGTDKTAVAEPDGKYLFVNRIDEPTVIRVTKEAVGIGHSSLAYKVSKESVEFVDGEAPDINKRSAPMVPMYFAGEMSFDKGEMVIFNNRSGHYLPSRENYTRTNHPLRARLLRPDLALF